MSNRNDYPDLTEQQLDAIAVHMHDDIREDLHGTIAPCEPGEFLTAYMQRDPNFPLYQFSTE